MGSPYDRDRLDAWLNAEVEPLAPPPGTFERIRRGARRRKLGRAMMSAASIVIVIAAAVTVPRITSAVLQSHNGTRRPVAAGTSSSPRTPTPASATAKSNARSSTPVPQAGSALGTSAAPVPGNFQPTSVTFVSQHTGAVIGQAGAPGHCATRYCTSLAATSDYGTTWYGVSAPVTSGPDGSSGVSQVRFLNARDGWAFGPGLWVTHDGGARWSPEQTYGMRVTDLETAGDYAFAIFARCTGSGPRYAADCTSFSLYASQSDNNGWQPVPTPATGTRRPGTGAGRSSSASLVLVGATRGTGYLLAPSGELLSGPLTGADWKVASEPVVTQQVGCLPGAPGPTGQPTGTLLAADANLLLLVCTGATSTARDTQAKVIVESTNRGTRWATIGAAPKAGIATSVAIQAQDNLVVLATDAGIYQSTNGGGSWQLTQQSPSGAAPGQAGFSYVGMTSPTNGVALPADAGLHEVFITTNGGSSWLPRPVSSP